MVHPRTMLAQVNRLLKPGGIFVVEVPNFGSWQARMGPRDWFHLDVPRHLLHFEKPTLARMVQAEGFEPIKWSTFSIEYDAYGMMQTLLNRLSSTPNWLFQHLIEQRGSGTARDAIVAVLLTPILAPLSWLVSIIAPAFGKGGVLRVVARKK
jgi:SAM-dependent methyltransferase